MQLYIRIKDGQPFEHPIFADNFCQAFPDVDINNLPSEFAKFERVETPTLGIYEVLASETPTYELVDGVYKDVWHKRDMTDEEKTQKQQLAKDRFHNHEQSENWSAWVFDEETCTMKPPIPRPPKIDGVVTMWCGAENNWKIAPTFPVDGNQYKFDYFAWQWVQVVN